jgi:hypothetical protein
MYLPIKKEKEEIKEINEDRVAYGADNSPSRYHLATHGCPTGYPRWHQKTPQVIRLLKNKRRVRPTHIFL